MPTTDRRPPTGNMRLKTGQVFLDELFPAVQRGLDSGELVSAFPYYAVHAQEDAIPVTGAPPPNHEQGSYYRVIVHIPRCLVRICMTANKSRHAWCIASALCCTDATLVDAAFSAVKEMMAVSKSEDKQLREIMGHSHQLLTDPGWEVVLQGIVEWIERRTNRV